MGVLNQSHKHGLIVLMRKILGILLIASTVLGADADWSWVKDVKHKSTNPIVIREFYDFIILELPSYKADFGFEKKGMKSTLQTALGMVLGGPPKPVKRPNDHSAVLTACRYQSCDEKGFYWADSDAKKSVMAMVHFFYEGKYEKNAQLFLASKNYKCDAIPEEVKKEIKEWLKSESVVPTKTRCLEEGKVFEKEVMHFNQS
jgi:hypothetical protein